MGYASLLEDAIERYESEQTRMPEVLRNPKYECRTCGQEFLQQLLLRAHIVEEHFHPRPQLLINGVEPAAYAIFRQGVNPAVCQINNCSRALYRVNSQVADYQEIDPREIVNMIGQLQDGVIDLHLEQPQIEGGTSSHSSYRLEVRTDDPLELDRLEQTFLELHNAGTSGDKFTLALHQAQTQNRTGKQYADALLRYVLAARERSRDMRFGPVAISYPHQYFYALGILADYTRTVAQLIAALIRFDMNLFGVRYQACGVPDLDGSFIFFRQVWDEQLEPISEAQELTDPLLAAFYQQTSSCRVAEVVAYAGKQLETAGRTEAIIEQIADLRTTYEVAEEDEMKLTAILCLAHTKRGDLSYTRQLSDRLYTDSFFRRWTEELLAHHGEVLHESRYIKKVDE